MTPTAHTPRPGRQMMRAARRSHLTYPISLFWAAASATCIGIAREMMSWQQAVIILLGLAVLLVGCAIRSQLTQMHSLVNVQRDELIQEVRMLRETLNEAGVHTPVVTGRGHGREPH